MCVCVCVCNMMHKINKKIQMCFCKSTNYPSTTTFLMFFFFEWNGINHRIKAKMWENIFAKKDEIQGNKKILQNEEIKIFLNKNKKYL